MPSTSKAIKELKNVMGYTEEKPKTCASCRHMVETDGVLDRTWIQTCTLNPALVFTVSNSGRCKHHAEKTSKTKSVS